MQRILMIGVIAGAVLAVFETASAQNVEPPADAALTFEVASIKAQPPMLPTRSLQGALASSPYAEFRGSRFKATNATAAWLIREAHGRDYRLREQVVGGSEWLDQDRFEIDALAPDVKPVPIDAATPGTVLEMLRSLLETRFKLRVRREMREGPVYALVRARRDGRLGVGIKVSGEDCTELGKDSDGERVPRRECFSQYSNDGIRRVGTPMESFVQSLERRVGRVVINETGLSSPVDLFFPRSTGMAFTALNRVGVDSELFTALEDVMGLKLENRRAPIPVLVVEHIERPTEN
jgi:uncharacterized protein (TIGR03435 family)